FHVTGVQTCALPILGNLAVHTDKSISRGDAILSLASLFEFIQWIDYCYGTDYMERRFDERLIPTETIALDIKKIKEQQSLLEQKESEIEALRAQIEALRIQLTANREKNRAERHFAPEDLSEFETRKRFIDVDLKLLGWTFGDDVLEEVELYGMPNPEGRQRLCRLRAVRQRRPSAGRHRGYAGFP